MRKDSQRNRSCIQDIGWQRQNKWRRKDIQRICVKRSCIQDIGWQRQNSGQDGGEKIHKEAALSTPVFRTLGGKDKIVDNMEEKRITKKLHKALLYSGLWVPKTK